MWYTFFLAVPPFLYMSMISWDILLSPLAFGLTRRRSLWSIAASDKCKAPACGRGCRGSSTEASEATEGARPAVKVLAGVPGVYGLVWRPSWLSGHSSGFNDPHKPLTLSLPTSSTDGDLLSLPGVDTFSVRTDGDSAGAAWEGLVGPVAGAEVAGIPGGASMPSYTWEEHSGLIENLKILQSQFLPPG